MHALAADRARILQGVIDDQMIGGLDADRFAVVADRDRARDPDRLDRGPCSSIPASEICRQNSIAEPSSAGTSSSVLMSRLLIPIPWSADIRCSTVRTRAPASRERGVVAGVGDVLQPRRDRSLVGDRGKDDSEDRPALDAGSLRS